MPDEYPHLTANQVARILEIVQDTDAVVIGGQSVNLWATHYSEKVPELAQRGPFTSKDIDFFGDRKAAEKVAEALGGTLYVPRLDDATPNAAVVVGELGDRTVEIDFMRVVLGVEDTAVKNNFVTLRGRNPVTGAEIRLMLLHPIDCLRSRFANVNTLAREDELSLRQASIAIEVLKLFIDELLNAGQRKAVQRILHDLYFDIRDDFVRGCRARNHPELNPMRAMKAFAEHPALDERWRSNNLASMIIRLERMLAKLEAEPQADPGPPGP